MQKMKRLISALLVLAMLACYLPPAQASAVEVSDAAPIALDTEVEVTISELGDRAAFRFTPEVTCVYTFECTQQDSDSYGRLYDADGNALASDDDGGNGSQFKLAYQMTAGTEYILEAAFYGDSSTGSMTVLLTQTHQYSSEVTQEGDCQTEEIVSYTCDLCGYSYEETHATSHEYGSDGICVNCGTVLNVSGSCGDDMTWSLSAEDCVLRISGSGKMTDYTYDSPAPWKAYQSFVHSAVVEAGVTHLGSHAFYGCASLDSVALPEGLVELGECAFGACTSLTGITLPSTLESLGAGYTFVECTGLESISLPALLQNIGDRPFSGCSSLTGIWVDEANKWYASDEYGVLFNADMQTLYWAPGAMTGSYTVSDGVQSISSEAFSGCSGLTAVILPNSMRYIEYGAFSRCASLTEMEIPEGTRSIGGYAFSDCTGLQAVTLPVSLEDLHYDAFNNCTALESIVLPEGLTIISDGLFSGCTGLKSVTILGQVETIEARAFSRCTSLETIELPDSLVTIGDSAFADCTSLKRIEIPGSVEWLNGRVFENCTALESVTLSDGLLYIGEGAFLQCTSLTSITLPDTVTSMYGSAFAYSGLTEITIPASVGYMGDWMFEGAESLTTITFRGECPEMSNTTFSGLTAAAYYPAQLSDSWSLFIENYTGGVTWEAYTAECHAYGAWQRVSDPTCTEDGQESRTCLYCGEEEIRTITAPGHSWYYDSWNGKEWVMICSVCGATETRTSMSGTCGQNLTWTLTNDGTMTISGTGAMDDYDYWDARPWVNYFDRITTLVVEEGVTSIGKMAFQSCNITSLSLPSTLETIGEYALYNIAVTELTLPDSVISIGSSAFSACFSLESLTLSANLEEIGRYAFADCTALEGVVTIPASVTAIGDSAFQSSYNIGILWFEGDAPSIGSDAFLNVTALAIYPVDNSTWTEDVRQDYGGSLTWQAYGDGAVISGQCGDNVTWTLENGTLTLSGSGDTWYYNGDNTPWYAMRSLITALVVEEGVTSLMPYALNYASNLTQISLPASLTKLGGYCFWDCASLASIDLPEGLTEIGYGAFIGCSSLTSLTIPASVTDIGPEVIRGCTSLTALTVAEGSGTYLMQDGVLMNSSKSRIVCALPTLSGEYVVPDTVSYISSGAFAYCTGLTSVIIPDSIAFIDGLFQGCTSLSQVQLPESLNSIGSNTFRDCISLTSVEIPGSVTQIGAGAFENSGLTSVTLPAAVRSLFSGAFSDCDNLTSVTLQEGLKYIWSTAFYDCDSLTEITIPVSVTTVDSSAFAYCNALSKITFLGWPSSLSYEAFSGVTATVYYPGVISAWADYTAEDALMGDLTWVSFTPDPDAHAWTDWEVRSEATCDNDGVEYRACLYHEGEEETRTIAAPGHSWYVSDYTDGTWTLLCSNCDTENVCTEITGSCGENVTYTLTSDGTMTISGTGAIRDYTYEGILYNLRDYVTNLVVESGITEIGSYAFYNYYNLVSVTLSEGLTRIGDNAFMYCYGIRNLELPDSLTTIGAEAFYSVSSGLRTISIPANVTTIGSRAFGSCWCLSTVYFEGPAPEIGAEAFANITATIRYNGEDDSWADLIGNQYGGTLTWYPYGDIIVASGTCGDNTTWALNGNGLLTISGTGVLNCSADTWSEIRMLINEIVIEDGITSVPYNAFEDLDALTTVTIGSGVTYLGSYAFFDCSSLTTVNLSEGLETIANGVFMYTSISELHIPASVSNISSGAFEGCTLNAITVAEGSTSYLVRDGILYSSDLRTLLKACATVSGSITIPSTVTSMGGSAFTCCEFLTEVILPEGLTQIPDNAFVFCPALESINIPSTVTYIGYSAFNCCPKLKAIALPDGLQFVSDYCFAYCSSLETIEIPDSVTRIGFSAFEGCSSLNNVVLPAGLTSIGSYAFNGCSSLESITIPAGVDFLDCGVFSRCTSLTSLTLNEGLEIIYEDAFRYCQSLTSVTIPATVQTLENAFGLCENLSTITFVGCPTSIGDYAFDSVTATVCYPAGVSAWDAYVDNDFGGLLTWVSYTPEEGAHAWTSWIVDQGADCENPGSAHRSCLYHSDEYETKILPALGHDFYDLSLSDGQWTGTCMRCGTTMTFSSISGSCGEDLTWNLTSDGTLTISGTGVMTEYTSWDAPWFVYAADIVKIVIEDGVATIGSRAFYGCSAVRSVSIPDSVVSIGSMAFWGCPSDLTLDIPATVSYVGSGAFLGISANGISWSPVTAYGTSHETEWQFDGATGTLTVTGEGQMLGYPNEYPTWYYFRDDLKNLVISEGVTLIGGDAFYDCTSLETVELPETLAVIGEGAFNFCSALTSILIPAGVTSVESYAFGHCTSLTEILFEGDAPTISDTAFFDTTATAYYPAGNDTWTEDVLQNYGGTITWVPYGAALEITKQPTSVTVAEGKTASVSVEVAGTGELTYKWYFAAAGSTKFSLTTSFTGPTYSVAMTSARNGRQVYCVISDAYGNSVTTDTVTLNMATLEITKQPTSVTVAEGKTAAISVEVAGTGELTYKWYFAAAGSTKFSLTTSFTGPTYSVAMTSARNGRQVYCVISDAYGNSVTTDTVTLNMATLEITKQPTSVTVAEGKTAAISVEVAGTGELTYKWYFAAAGSTKFSLTTSFTGPTYSVAMTSARNGRQVYCVISDAYGNSVTTDTVTLNMEEKVTLEITKQPTSVTVAEGKTASVSVEVAGTGELTYKWYFAAAGSTKFSLTTSFTGPTYSVAMTSARNGRQVYCVISDAYGNSVTTDTVTLNMEEKVTLEITKQPTSVTVAEGKTASVSVEVAGTGELTYQWYWAAAGSSKFYLTTSFTGPTYSVAMTSARNGRQVYCVISDTYGNSVTTNTVTLNMAAETELKITKQPANATVASGKVASTTVTAEGDGLTYTWYVLDPGASSWVKSSITKSTYSVSMSAAKSGRHVYCVITDANGNSVTTNIVTLNMTTDITISSQPANAAVSAGSTAKATVTASGDGLTYTWYVLDPGSSTWVKSSITKSTYSVALTAAKSGRQVYCVITDANGNSVSTNVVTLTVK